MTNDRNSSAVEQLLKELAIPLDGLFTDDDVAEWCEIATAAYATSQPGPPTDVAYEPCTRTGTPDTMGGASTPCSSPADASPLFTSVVQSFVVVDATPEELVDWYAQEAAQEARGRTQRTLDKLRVDSVEDMYGRSALTWEKASCLDEEHGGDST